jgi:hypothetical protein
MQGRARTERVGFEPKVGSQAVPKLALAGATREKTIQEVDGLLPGPAGLLRLATITPRPNFDAPGGLGWDHHRVYAGDKSVFSIRSVLATDFAA